MKLPSSNHVYKRGFTLLEMLVVIGIFIIFSTVMVVDYNKFGEHEKFVNFMYDTALNIRQIQTSGIGVKVTTTDGTEQYNNAYGLHFKPSEVHQYTTFIDQVDYTGARNKTYNEADEDSSGDDVIKTIDFNQDYNLEKVCTERVVNGTRFETTDCATIANEKSVDVVFIRPNPDACITFEKSDGSTESDAVGNCNGGTNTYTGAKLYFSNTKNTDQRVIYIDATGQISIQ